MPIEAQVSPLPSDDTTPPVTKMCLHARGGVMVQSAPNVHAGEPGGPRETVHQRFTQLSLYPNSSRCADGHPPSRDLLFSSPLATAGQIVPIHHESRRGIDCAEGADCAV